MRALLALIIALALSACAGPLSAQSVPIKQAETEDDFDKAQYTRWNIEVYSGLGLPGSPGADQYIKDYLEVLQAIVDQCELGATILTQATDGVSLLAILNDDLTDKQLACVRDKERVGLRLVDWGTRG